MRHATWVTWATWLGTKRLQILAGNSRLAISGGRVSRPCSAVGMGDAEISCYPSLLVRKHSVKSHHLQRISPSQPPFTLGIFQTCFVPRGDVVPPITIPSKPARIGVVVVGLACLTLPLLYWFRRQWWSGPWARSPDGIEKR